MKVAKGTYQLHLSSESPCIKCVCLYCYNLDCPYYKKWLNKHDKIIHHRCDLYCGSFYEQKKPLDFCDFFLPVQRPKPKIFKISRRYRRKTEHQLILERIAALESTLAKLIEKLYNNQ